MTPISLSMTAFGAYVEQVTIDFAHGLRGEKIFLIHGATGAGKTTILDAITYALYGETSGKARDGKDMRSKGVADSIPTIVEFTFALGNKTYKVWREINYSSRRKDNKYQTRAELSCDGHLIADRDRTVKKRIMELLGFDADQFRQVVLLPQGEFKRFLSADSDKRQEVLNILFDSTPYQEIEVALSERAKTSAETVKGLEAERDALKRQLNGADSNALPDIEARLLSARSQAATLKRKFDSAQVALTEGKRLADRFADADKARKNLQAAQIDFAEAEKIFTAAQAEYQQREAEEAQRKQGEETIRELKSIQSTLTDLNKQRAARDKEQAKLADAEESFKKCDDNAKRYEARMNQLTNDKARLECEKVLGEVLQLEAALVAAKEKVSTAEKNLNVAQIEWNRLQIVNNAARLAMTLKDGEPCPVCGSLEHPAIITAVIPTIAELRNAEDTVKRLTDEKSRSEKNAAQIEGQLVAKKNQLNDKSELEAAQKSFVSLRKTETELEDCIKRLAKGEDCIKQNDKALDAADKRKKAAQSAVDKFIGAIAELQKKIPETYSTASQQLNADLNAAQTKFNQLDSLWTLAQKNFNDARNKKSAREATRNAAQKTFEALTTELKGKTPPDTNLIEQATAQVHLQYDAALREKAKLETAFDTLKKVSSELEKVEAKLTEAKEIADTWRTLSDVANATGKGESDLKISFQRYFLSTMFNDVVTEANNRLKKMSNGRYLFQQKDAGKTKAKTAGLNLEIFDEQTGALRPVETLSGGESFLASLSLALGLASTVRNKVGGIKLDTIFIDEGFGSLDAETLDLAISTITEQSGGRLVGIISHVEELKNQMPVRLEVIKGKIGSTARFVH